MNEPTFISSASAMPETMLHPYQLGASLYMPATREDVWAVISRSKLPNLDSVIICLEDAVSESDVPYAWQNIQKLLAHWASVEVDRPLTTHRSNSLNAINESTGVQKSAMRKSSRPLVFIRPRNPQMLMQLATLPHIDLIDGYVLPKVDMDSLSNWRLACQQVQDNSLLMPTLETGRLFDSAHNQALATALAHAFDERVFALRIGGNDLFSALRLRRPSTQTIYETPVGTLMHQLIGTFVPQGYYLTAPVCEYFDNTALFIQELATDVSLGLVGKTVIHPAQIALVQQAFSVSTRVLEEAQAILAQDAKAVFKHNNTMLEPATHYAWAVQTVKRAQIFGVLANQML
nr:HpcH/HpaI aldolase/citrate lyase family protein [Psychrobacter sp.]